MSTMTATRTQAYRTTCVPGSLFEIPREYVGKRVEIVIKPTLENVPPRETLDIESQLNSIAKLKEGWFDGKGSAFNHDELKRLSDKFEQNFSSDIDLPYLYPTPDDSIRAEWTFKKYEVSLEIEIPSLNAYYHQLNIDTNEDVDAELELDKIDGWNELNGKLRKIHC
ncbi:MAG: hypothetical protein FWC26_05590 [Fibromonadales bacterium]|nr:hypothetical protein [Fibromonadales bacterium]